MKNEILKCWNLIEFFSKIHYPIIIYIWTSYVLGCLSYKVCVAYIPNLWVFFFYLFRQTVAVWILTADFFDSNSWSVLELARRRETNLFSLRVWGCMRLESFLKITKLYNARPGLTMVHFQDIDNARMYFNEIRDFKVMNYQL